MTLSFVGLPNSFIHDNALLLSLVQSAVRCILHPHVMQSKDCSLAFVFLLQILHVFFAIIVVLLFQPVVPKGSFGRNRTGTQVHTGGT